MTALVFLARWAKMVPAWAWACIALATFGGLQTARLHHAKADLVVAHRDLTISEANVRNLGGLLRVQNEAIAKAKAERDRAAADLAAALVKAKPVAARHQAKAAALSVYTPKGDDALAQLVDLDREIER